MKRRVRRYTDEERKAALAVVAANGGGHPAIVAAARQLGIPRETVKTWAEQHAEEIALVARAVEQGLLPLAWEARQKALERLLAEIETGALKGRDLAVVFGILDDKVGGWTGRGVPGGANIGIQINVPREVGDGKWALFPDD